MMGFLWRDSKVSGLVLLLGAAKLSPSLLWLLQFLII